MPSNIQLVTDPKKAKALANETRIRILQEIATTSQSISQLARKIKISPVAVFYHIRKLTNAGFIQVAKTTIVNNNLTEKFYEITTDAYLVAVSEDSPVKGPVPPKKQLSKEILGITTEDIEKTFRLLGLTYLAENKDEVEEKTITLLRRAMHEAGDVQRVILNQFNLKLSADARLKVEYAAMAVVPLVLARLLDKAESLEVLRSIVKGMRKTENKKME